MVSFTLCRTRIFFVGFVLAFGACTSSRLNDTVPSDGPSANSNNSGGAAAPVSSAGTHAAGVQLDDAPPSVAADSVVAAPETGQSLVARELWLAETLTGAGFVSLEAVPASEFAPLPPGASASGGAWQKGEQIVRIGLFVYPNDRFASPHARDVNSRPVRATAEAAIATGSFVVHIVAANIGLRDAVAATLSRALGLPVTASQAGDAQSPPL